MWVCNDEMTDEPASSASLSDQGCHSGCREAHSSRHTWYDPDVHETSTASDQDVLRVEESLEFGTAREYWRLFPELLFDICSRIEDG
jgi:hypothetical protein